MNLKSFSDLLQIHTGRRHILLGNGFSISRSDKFNYQRLLDNTELDKNVKNIFEHLKTADFEIVINRLENTSEVLKSYNEDYTELSKTFDEKAKQLRNQFAESISNHHILYRDIFGDIPPNTCSKFLSHFETIFTTNYDLLLYWTIMYNDGLDDSKKIKIPSNDGFGSFGDDLVWKGNNQNVFYIHGSLFLTMNEEDVLVKLRKNGDLLSIIKNNISEDRLPLIVLEGDSNTKHKKIFSDPYLYDALENLKCLDGNLFIYGHSLNITDKHIFDKINESKIKNICISVYDVCDDILDRANSYFKNKEIAYFDAKSANVWDSKD